MTTTTDTPVEGPDVTFRAQQCRVDRQLKVSTGIVPDGAWLAQHEAWKRYGALPWWRQMFRTPPGRPPREFARFLYDALSQEF